MTNEQRAKDIWIMAETTVTKEYFIRTVKDHLDKAEKNGGRDCLERAARLCESLRYRTWTAMECAEEIRKLALVLMNRE